MRTTSTSVTGKLPNGTLIRIEATAGSGEQDVAAFESVAEAPDLDGIREAVEGVGQLVTKAIENVRPTSASVEFGIDVALESGKLTALLVKGEAKAHLKIRLEWIDKR